MKTLLGIVAIVLCVPATAFAGQRPVLTHGEAIQMIQKANRVAERPPAKNVGCNRVSPYRFKCREYLTLEVAETPIPAECKTEVVGYTKTVRVKINHCTVRH